MSANLENSALAYRTGKGQFSFRCQRKAMPKNVQTTTQLHSSHMLVKKCLKFSKPGFSNMWTMNFLMFKLVSEKAEEPDIKLQHPLDHRKSRRVPKNISFCFIDYAKAFDCVDHNKLWKILKEMGVPEHLTCLLRNLHAGQEATIRIGHGTTDCQEQQYVKAVYCHPAYLTSMQSTSWETLGWRKHKLESRFPGEISITSDVQMTTPLWQKVKN